MGTFKNNHYKFLLAVLALDLCSFPVPFLCAPAGKSQPQRICWVMDGKLPSPVHGEQGSPSLSCLGQMPPAAMGRFCDPARPILPHSSTEQKLLTELLPTGPQFYLLSTAYFTENCAWKHCRAHAASPLVSGIIKTHNTTHCPAFSCCILHAGLESVFLKMPHK